ncbi:fungal specific transcription factor domain containing protein [Grosmannia clavigera kw1407]|uniref:Fungal specific transcription factor domain containing protein n=1 Tax=Grosmannia clavigera (strain kw1407 / UAMH 11150) TaxID=655863 RepID=F0XEE2_GROCL|nr:fungal specific transcription factor domain containing protein [Grosmannia clavigera kw1407]EFX03879.1 fungal specific transcription factor domain containing protein [Grosmannia clavigera kw1407]
MASIETTAIRRMRKQVTRACDFCRARRIGCDSSQPCKACRQRGLACTTTGEEGSPRSLPAAQREIEQLLRKVKDLEAEVADLKQRQPASQLQAVIGDSRSQSHSLSPSKPCSRPRPQWEGIHVATSGSDQASYYGPSSSYYLVSRMGGYLGKMLKQPYTEKSLQPRSTRADIYQNSPAVIDEGAAKQGEPQNPRHVHTGALSRAQEESVLRLFWEGYHCTMPIVDETAFRTSYASLWEPSRSVRRPCPLVDCIIALCLQNGYAYIPKPISRQASAGIDNTDDDSREAVDDAAVAGRWYFLRAQSGLTADLESPSLETVQCYIFMISYLCCASFQNMCHVVSAQAVRTAHILGLHLDPSSDLPHGERERRRRIWWVLWSFDAKVSTKHGRPLVIDQADVTAALPSDDCEAAAYNGSTLGMCGPLAGGGPGGASGDAVTWLTYARQNQKLHLVMTDIHQALFFRCGEVVHERALACIYHDPAALEDSAGFLAARLPQMRDWASAVPSTLRTRRRRGGQPYSTDRSPLDLDDALAPVWLQRQAVSLELTYHALVVQLTRAFITFYKHPGTYTPAVDRLAATCADHAVAFTHLMHQAVTETDLMAGWSEYFSLQWSASLVMVAFVLAYPVHAATPRARAALEKAVAVFVVFGEHFALTAVEDDLAWLDPNRPDDMAGGPYVPFNMDWAISVDNFNSFDKFFDAHHSSDSWAFLSS